MLRLHSHLCQLPTSAANVLASQGGRLARNHGYKLPQSLSAVFTQSKATVAATQQDHEIKPITKLMVANRGKI